jgi:hypothetical protein
LWILARIDTVPLIGTPALSVRKPWKAIWVVATLTGGGPPAMGFWCSGTRGASAAPFRELSELLFSPRAAGDAESRRKVDKKVTDKNWLTWLEGTVAGMLFLS